MADTRDHIVFWPKPVRPEWMAPEQYARMPEELMLREAKVDHQVLVTLSCQTPQMNEKQLWVHLLAYNVIRLLMAQAACQAGVDPRGLSFKHTVNCGPNGQRAAYALRRTTSGCSC